jgi:hypothetical protein
MAQSPPPRYFTVEEATAVLPRVRTLVQELQLHAAELGRAQRMLQDRGRVLGTGPGTRTNGHGPNGAGQQFFTALQQADRALRAIRRSLEEIEQIGCEVKDIHTGLVDFRTMRDGRAVYLCWRLGEERIQYWHELDAGFSGRQPL